MFNSGELRNLNIKDNIKNILMSHGYPVSESSDYLNTSAIWRGGSDPKSVAIYYNQGVCCDFVSGTKFDVKTLISLVTNQKDDKSLQEYLSKNNVVIESSPAPVIKTTRIFSNDILKELLPIYDYWINRGISEQTLKDVGGGIYNYKGIFKGKYLFYISNSKNQIVGLAGRDVSGNDGNYKWVLRGNKASWCYPASINYKIIKDKNSVFLVESVGDMLSLFECGIKNVLVLFGTELNLSIINLLLKINIGKIYISTNDDSLGNYAGNNAAEKIYKRLNKYFSSSQIKTVHPLKCGDWNEVLTKHGKHEIIKQLEPYI